jgi:hypothetical protein
VALLDHATGLWYAESYARPLRGVIVTDIIYAFGGVVLLQECDWQILGKMQDIITDQETSPSLGVQLKK